MQPQSFETSDILPLEQFEAWRDWSARVVDIEALHPVTGGFGAKSETWIMNGIALSHVRTPGVRVSRTRKLLGRSPIDPWVISVGRASATSVSAGKRSFLAPPGEPFLVSLGHELTSQRDADSQLQLYLSRDEVPELAPILDVAGGSIIAGGMGTLLADYLTILERNLPNIDADEALRLHQPIVAMVAACVAPTPDREDEAAKLIDLTRMERVRRAVRTYLHSPALGPRLLCRVVGVSRSQLYRLLEPKGGVARYIRQQRLLAAYAMVSDASNHLPIAQIAEKLCFADGSNFSRAFRQEFGISPREVRATPLAQLPSLRQSGARTTLEQLLISARS